MNRAKEGKDTFIEDEDRDIVGYIRVSTDLQDAGKQKDTILHWARRERLKVTRFIGGEISSTRSLTASNWWKGSEGDSLGKLKEKLGKEVKRLKEGIGDVEGRVKKRYR